MAQPLIDVVEQFCLYQRKQRGKTEGGVKTYRWNLTQFLEFVRGRRGRLACLGDLDATTVQAWMDDMAAGDLAVSTMRVRQSTVSSLCAWLVKRGQLSTNPVTRLDRPPHRREAPRQVPGPAIMDTLIKAARDRRRPRDLGYPANSPLFRNAPRVGRDVAGQESGPWMGRPQRPGQRRQDP